MIENPSHRSGQRLGVDLQPTRFWTKKSSTVGRRVAPPSPTPPRRCGRRPSSRVDDVSAHLDHRDRRPRGRVDVSPESMGAGRGLLRAVRNGLDVGRIAGRHRTVADRSAAFRAAAGTSCNPYSGLRAAAAAKRGGNSKAGAAGRGVLEAPLEEREFIRIRSRRLGLIWEAVSVFYMGL